MAERLGRTRAELLATISSEELTDWIVLEQIRSREEDDELRKLKKSGPRAAGSRATFGGTR